MNIEQGIYQGNIENNNNNNKPYNLVNVKMNNTNNRNNIKQDKNCSGRIKNNCSNDDGCYWFDKSVECRELEVSFYTIEGLENSNFRLPIGNYDKKEIDNLDFIPQYLLVPVGLRVKIWYSKWIRWSRKKDI